MSQISPPMRIMLAGALLFLAAWMTVLRPGPVEPEAPATSPTSAPVVNGAAPQSAPGQAAAAAQNAAGTAEQAAAARAGQAAVAPGTAPATSAIPVAPGQAAPVEAPKVDFKAAGVPDAVAKDLGEKVTVLLFWNRKAADDRAVNRAVKGVFRHRGQVAIHRVPIANVSKYAAITRGADVAQSPTVLVVDRRLSVEPLVGYVDTTSIDQVVVDAFLNEGEKVDTVKYLQKLEGYCSGANRRLDSLDDITSPRRLRRAVSAMTPTLNRLFTRVRALKPPPAYRAMHKDLIALIKLDKSILARVNTFVRGGAVNSSALRRELNRHRSKSYALDLELAAAGLTACR